MRRLAVLASILLAGCPAKPQLSTPRPQKYSSTQTPSLSEELLPLPRFVDVAANWGIAFQHENGASPEKLLPETMGAGVCLVDLDDDGRLDILFANGRSLLNESAATPVVAYRNEGERFVDATEKLGLASIPSRHAMGVYAARLSPEGPPDLFVTAFDGALFLRFREGKYRDATAEAGLSPPLWKDDTGKERPAWSTAAAWFDADRDGKLDLLVGHYVQWTRAADVASTLDGRTKAYATPELYRGISPRLYRQVSEGRFEDATERLGFLNEKAKTLGIALGLMGDRFAVAVTNDSEPNNFYVWKDGKYVDEGLARGIGFDEQGKPRAGMGVDLVEESGSWTLAVGHFSRESTALFRGVEKVAIDRAPASGLAAPTRSMTTFGLAFLDLDRDGRLDLALANGHVEPTVGTKQKDVAYEEQPQLFRARAAGKLEDVSAACGLEKPLVARGLAVGDLDGDGFVDLVLTQNGGAPVVLRAEPPRGAGNVVRILLKGKPPNRDAIGARVTVNGVSQSRRTAGSYLSQHEPALTFGLGKSESASVVVRWPSGKESKLEAKPGLVTISEE